jgi:aspartyl-tRNA(Asn)/glutamyl-tRNA(Gln) amidotransferase subunit A
LTRIDPQLAFASIAEIGKLFRAGKLSPLELTRFLLDRIEALNPKLNVYLTVDEAGAIKAATRAESTLCLRTKAKSRQDLGPLHGIPISLKDNIYTSGVRTTAGSEILRNFVPLHDAYVVTTLKKAGTVILGKTNLHEFAYGVTTVNPHYGPTRNPWDLQRIAGGSSGGSAAALAAGLCYGSIGTDTGGSIRVPSSLCGVVGLKPGIGCVSTDGVIPLSATLDFVGPLARTVRDTALLFSAISTKGKHERGFLAGRVLSPRKRRMRLGIPKEFFFEVLSPEVDTAIHASLRTLEKKGVKLVKVSLPLLAETEDAGNQIAWAEATQYHQQAGWYPAHAALYGEDVRSRLEMGTKVSAVSYLSALDLREKFIEGYHSVLENEDLDAFVVPTTPIPAPRIGEDETIIKGKKYPTRALLLRLNRPANLAGVPAISVPCGFTPQRLPVGLQLMGAVSDEALLLEFAQVVESAMPLPVCPALEAPK